MRCCWCFYLGNGYGALRKHLAYFCKRIRFSPRAFLVMPENVGKRSPRFALKQRCQKPAIEGKKRSTVIDHKLDSAAGFTYADNFSQAPRSVGRVVNHSPGI